MKLLRLRLRKILHFCRMWKWALFQPLKILHNKRICSSFGIDHAYVGVSNVSIIVKREKTKWYAVEKSSWIGFITSRTFSSGRIQKNKNNPSMCFYPFDEIPEALSCWSGLSWNKSYSSHISSENIHVQFQVVWSFLAFSAQKRPLLCEVLSIRRYAALHCKSSKALFFLLDRSNA